MNDRYTAMMQSWGGHNINQVVVAWGAATRVVELPDHSRMYEWGTVDGTNEPPERAEHFARVQERGGAAWCSSRFVVAANGAITSEDWSGSNYDDGIHHIGCYTEYQAPASPPPPPGPPVGLAPAGK